MKWKEWLLLSLAIILFAGGGYALFEYRSGKSTQTQAGNTEAGSATSTGKGQTSAGNMPKELQAQIEQWPADKPYAHLWVTRDYGHHTLFAKVVPIEANDTVMDVLTRQVKEVKTSYGGGFVDSILGLASTYKPGDASSKKQDWFYYVNGRMADVGAREYPIATGDVIWWDYHEWGEGTFDSKSIAAAYPHPFVPRGQEQPAPLVIMAAKGFEKQADQVAQAISKVRGQSVTAAAWDENRFQTDTDSTVIVVGDSKSLASSAFLQEISQDKGSVGLLVDLTAEGITSYDSHGKKVKTYTEPNTGAIISATNPYSGMPLWIVAGTGAEGVDVAAEAFHTSEQPAAPKWYAHVGVLFEGHPSQSVRLPVLAGNGTQQ
ncbi:DUF4430 domain-containing protein [Brevibacillus dissolubilis]|uniref:DUF4430 domain-containing protein n=1 Tax=Brevibacillus dissolubilis TaxID=1844116 RepID=UPI0011172C1C|nr:DUF4430 domain-containing protein [Brevibacillus dissolubilis]